MLAWRLLVAPSALYSIADFIWENMIAIIEIGTDFIVAWKVLLGGKFFIRNE